eukprot:1186507-Prorocentrum_minimum.AAC.5
MCCGRLVSVAAAPLYFYVVCGVAVCFGGWPGVLVGAAGRCGRAAPLRAGDGGGRREPDCRARRPPGWHHRLRLRLPHRLERVQKSACYSAAHSFVRCAPGAPEDGWVERRETTWYNSRLGPEASIDGCPGSLASLSWPCVCRLRHKLGLGPTRCAPVWYGVKIRHTHEIRMRNT